ncbi:MAG: hypothetical protein QME84_08455, partial [Actinomycetota bacterium]|nr:hypothetical protein [Actinomycetota bacterium]
MGDVSPNCTRKRNREGIFQKRHGEEARSADEAIPWGNAEEIASFMLAMTLLDRRRSLSRSAPRDDISCPCHGEEARSADEAIPWGNAEE